MRYLFCKLTDHLKHTPLFIHLAVCETLVDKNRELVWDTTVHFACCGTTGGTGSVPSTQIIVYTKHSPPATKTDEQGFLIISTRNSRRRQQDLPLKFYYKKLLSEDLDCRGLRIKKQVEELINYLSLTMMLIS